MGEMMVEFNYSTVFHLALLGLIFLGAVEVAREVFSNYSPFDISPLESTGNDVISDEITSDGIIGIGNPNTQLIFPLKSEMSYNKVMVDGTTTFYHGGPREAILDIYYNKRIIVGGSGLGWWLSDSFFLAREYASQLHRSEDGLIIAVVFKEDLDLECKEDNVFVACIDDPQPGQYYWFEGALISGVYDLSRNKLL